MTILDKIIEQKKLEVAEQKKLISQNALIEKATYLENTKNFYAILEKDKSNNNISLIAEVKKASPSKGIIREDFNHLEIAKTYDKAGASAISVLTDEKFFLGSGIYLKNIRTITEKPLLRKDFIVDEYQIYQTRDMGADIILLIASALDKFQLKEYYELSQELGLNILLEVHNHQEMELALDINATVIGINNRNLKTFDVSLSNTIELIKDFNPQNSYIISESGIRTPKDVDFLKNNGVSGILVGESLMNKNNIEKAIQDLLNL